MAFHKKHETPGTPAELKAQVQADPEMHPAVRAAAGVLLDALNPAGNYVLEAVGHLDPNGHNGKPTVGQNILIKIETRLARDDKGRALPLQPGTVDESAEIVRLKAELAAKGGA